jgi:hypothetical protein
VSERELIEQEIESVSVLQAAESALGKDWLTAEEDAAWADL